MRKIIFISIFAVSLFLCNQLKAEVVILDATFNGSVIAITGSGFGSKTNAAPFYFNNLEADVVGEMPTGFSANTNTYGGLVQADGGRGNHVSFEFDSTGAEQWQRDYIDLGVGGVDELFISTWLYIDKTGTTAIDWQIKSIVFGSDVESQGYFSSDPNQTTIGLQNWYRSSPEGWYNSNPSVYYNGLTNGWSGTNLPSDAYLFGEWQRIDLHAKRGTASTADGIVRMERVGRSTPNIFNVTEAITHDIDDEKWRIIGIGQGVASIAGGNLVLNVLYDDIYIDTSVSRVEVGDASTWSSCTHREIQILTAWGATGEYITATANQGSFDTLEGKYLYVVDSDGDVNENGFLIQTQTQHSTSTGCFFSPGTIKR